MKNFVRDNLYKIAYALLFVAVVIRVCAFEVSIHKERQRFEDASTQTVEYIVTSVPSFSDSGVSFIGKSSEFENNIYVYIKYGTGLDISIGDKIQLSGEISLPGKALNPGGYDFGKYIKSCGASLVMYSNVAMIKSIEPGPLKHVYNIRSRVSDNISKYLGGEEASLVNALVTGSKENMSDVQKENFRKAGIYHVIAVSGLHLGMLLMFLGSVFVSSRLRARKRKILLVIVTIAGSLFLCVFTGFGISVQRASFMALILCMAGLFSREYSPLTSLYLVFIFVVMADPAAYTDISMQLSFSATAGILIASQIIKKYKVNERKYGSLIQTLIITEFANIFTLPFVAYHFGSFSIIGIVSNMVILSFVPFLLIMSYIFSVLTFFAPEFICNFAANLVYAPAIALNELTKLFASVPYGYININLYSVFFTIFNITFLYLIAKNIKKRLSLVFIAIVIVANVIPLAYNTICTDVAVSFINVSQGECTLIEDNKGHSFMIDCGSENNEKISENEIIPYIKQKNTGKIDVLFVTHYHSDHTNGIYKLIEEGLISSVVLPKKIPANDEKDILNEIYRMCLDNGVTIHPATKDDVFLYGEHRFKVLHPDTKNILDANNGSLVLEYTYNNSKIIFMGDTEEKGQYMVMNSLSPCDVIKVAHHGAKNSLSQKVCQKTKPKYAVISCGKNNRYNHPSPQTLEAFASSEILRTDLTEGPIVFRMKYNIFTGTNKEKSTWKLY